MHIRKIGMACLLAAQAGLVAISNTDTWNGNSGIDDNWGTPTNWNGGIAPGNNDTLSFPSGPSHRTTNNNLSLTSIRGLEFGDSYTITGNVLNFINASVMISVNSGMSTIAAPISLGPNETMNISVTNAASNLIFTMPVTSDPTASLVFSGPGQMTIPNNTVTVYNDFTMQSGALLISNTNTVTTGNGAFLGAMIPGPTPNITINSGTLTIDNSGATSGSTENGAGVEGFGIIINGGTLNCTNSAIVNSDTIRNAGAGFVGISSLTINQATVNLVNTGSITGLNSIGSGVGAGSLTINNGTFNLQNSGPISGGGEPDLEAVGCLLSSAGLTTIAGGSFSLTNTGAVTSNAAAGTMLQSFAEIVMTGGEFICSNANNTVDHGIGSGISTTLSSFTMSGGSITLDNQGTVTSGAVGAALVIGNGIVMNGGSIQTSNSGSVSGTGSLGAAIRTSTLDLNAGTIINDAAITADTVTIGSSGLLKGVGTINDFIQSGSAVVSNGGVVHAGDSPGTLTILGSYSQTTGGVLSVDIDPAGDASLLAITTTIDIANVNTTVSVTPTPGVYHPGMIYTIVTNGGMRTGEFTNLAFTVPNFRGLLIYDLNDIKLELLGVPMGVVLPGSRAAACFDTLTSSDAVVILDSLSFSDLATIRRAFNQIEPSQLSALALAAENSTIRMRDGISERLAQIHRAICPKAKPSPSSPATQEDSRMPHHIWIDGFGDWAHQRESRQPGFHQTIGGGILGYDYQLSKKFYLGAALAYSYDHLTWDKGRGHGMVQNGYGLLYGMYTNNHFYIETILSGAYNFYEETRDIRFTTIHRKAKGSHNGGEAAANLTLGYAFRACSILYTPYASVDYIYLYEPSYQEHGAQSLDLKIEKKNSDLLRTETGLKFSHCFSLSCCNIIPELFCSWLYETHFLGKYTKASFRGSDCVFKVNAIGSSRNLVSPGAVLTVISTSGVSASVCYRGEYGTRSWNNEARFNLGWSF